MEQKTTAGEIIAKLIHLPKEEMLQVLKTINKAITDFNNLPPLDPIPEDTPIAVGTATHFNPEDFKHPEPITEPKEVKVSGLTPCSICGSTEFYENRYMSCVCFMWIQSRMFLNQ